MPPVTAQQSATDRELLAEYARSGSQEVFERIIAQHSGMVYRTCLRVSGDAHLAEDAAQATFLVLLRKAKRLPASTVLSGWLYRTAELAARDAMKAKGRRMRHEREALKNRPIAEGKEDRWEALKPKLDVALAALPAAQRDAIVLRYLNGYSEEEAAREIGCAPNTLHVRVTRGLVRLRERLGASGVSISSAALLPLIEKASLDGAMPAHLTANLAAACTGKAAVSAAVLEISKGVNRALFWAKAKSAIAAIMLVTAAAASGIVATNRAGASEGPTLPIEVLGANGTTREVTVNVPSASGITGLWLHVHNLSYDNKASVQINNGAWIPLNNAGVSVASPGKEMGGIGGAFSSLKLTVPLAAGSLQNGNNTLRFRFNASDGLSMGYRVLNFNFVTSTGAMVLSPLPQEDVSKWTPPRNTPADIAAGKDLWYNAPLKNNPGATSLIKARCTDCHTHDGRDLKYFNFSNHSIVERSKFHGLTPLQGEQIASYIRSLKVTNPGRPWNPPYQPGPGLDAKPLSEWAAGAGVEWILDRDQDTWQHIFPSGVNKTAVRPDGYISIREIPVAIQFPDWNHWLPQTHPKDRWPDFESSELAADYPELQRLLRAGERPRLGGPVLERFGAFGYHIYQFAVVNKAERTTDWTPKLSQDIYDIALWQGVKTWELMQEFELESYGPQIARPGAGDDRSWFQGYIFDFSPNLLKIPRNENGLRGNGLFTTYASHMWYQVQMTLVSNRWNDGQRPMDWGYTWGFFKDIRIQSDWQNAAQMYLTLATANQIITNGVGADKPAVGWNPTIGDPTQLVHFANIGMWRDTPNDLRRQVSEALIEAWLEKNLQYEPYRYWSNLSDFGAPQRGQDGVANPSAYPNGYPDGGGMQGRLWFMIPEFRKFGVNEALLNRVIDWAKTIFPKGGWDLLRDTNQRIPPRIIMYRPGDDAFNAPATVEFQVTVDEFAVRPAKIQFYADENTLIGEANSLAGVTTFRWSNVPAGKYVVSARVTAGNGQATSQSRTITVNGTAPANRAPKIYLQSPLDGTRLPTGTSFTIVSAAFENDLNDRVARVEFFDNNVKIGEVTGENWSGHHAFVYDNLPAGTRVITARATDTRGASTTSAPITINAAAAVAKAPLIVAQPRSRLVDVGERAHFSIIAEGSAPLSYQWQHNGVNIPGATQPDHSTGSATAADNNTQFRCVVSNSAGSVTSTIGVLSVGRAQPPLPPPGGGNDVSGGSDGQGGGGGGGGSGGGGAPGGSGTPKLVLGVTKLQAKLSFKASNADSCNLAALLPGVPQGFAPEGKTLAISVGGAVAEFVLDKRGRGASAHGRIALKLKLTRDKATKQSVFAGGSVPLSLQLKKGSWSALWQIDANATGALDRTMPILVRLDGRDYSAEVQCAVSVRTGTSAMVKKTGAALAAK